MKRLLEPLVRVADVLSAPLTGLAALWMKLLRRTGVQRLPIARRVLYGVGVFPVRDHYYEPLFHPRHLRAPLESPRRLPGLDLNEAEQLRLLASFRYQDELRAFPLHAASDTEYGYVNRSFGAGDAEVLYSMVRHFKPRRIVEIGSGRSTLMAAAAVKRNRADDAAYTCEHVCIEPYEMPWLERTGVSVRRQRVEDADPALFTALQANDILFIDSSHVIRPQSDVLTEFLEILPVIRPGVLVHVHDIYTPRDYPSRRIREEVRFWNEQYLLEALLSGSRAFRVLGALHHLNHTHRAALHAACPVLASRPFEEPASFWMVKNAA